LVPTLAGELKIAEGGRTRAIGISMKDRSAILPEGRMADGAYWFDNGVGNMVSRRLSKGKSSKRLPSRPRRGPVPGDRALLDLGQR
jgi:hypothetical protein